MKRAALALLAFVFILGLQLILSVVIGWLSGASWKSCLDGFLMLLYLQAFIGAIAGVGYALMWIFGAIMFAISNGYCFKDFIGKYHSKDYVEGGYKWWLLAAVQGNEPASNGVTTLERLM